MTGTIPRLVAKSLVYKSLDSKAIEAHVKSVEDQQANHISSIIYAYASCTDVVFE